VVREELRPTIKVDGLQRLDINLRYRALTRSTAAHIYLSSLCGFNSYTATSTRLKSSTSLIAADTSTLAKAVSPVSALSNLTAGTISGLPTSANATSLATTSIAVIIPSVVSTSGNGLDRYPSRKGGAAQWALVVVVFARSLMY
jgi:hypothetical protein